MTCSDGLGRMNLPTGLATIAPDRAARRAPRRRGFTLIELLVVVVIIGIVATLAVPSMRLATFDRHAYQDAGAVMQLFREARLRAVARGGAMLVTMNASGTSQRGTFMLYEADTLNANSGTAAAAYQTPVPSCKSPTLWNTGGTVSGTTLTTLVDGVNLNGSAESDADIETSLVVFGSGGSTPATGAPFSQAVICFTPLGRSYLLVPGQTGFSLQSPVFDGLSPNTNLVQAQVTRGTTTGVTSATIRDVLITPNGMPRLLSQGH